MTTPAQLDAALARAREAQRLGVSIFDVPAPASSSQPKIKTQPAFPPPTPTVVAGPSPARRDVEAIRSKRAAHMSMGRRGCLQCASRDGHKDWCPDIRF